MDANKLEVLRDLPFIVHRVCGLCRHGSFAPNTNWGTCGRTQYEHKKHTGPARQLSIVLFGSCARFEADQQKKEQLGAYQEFLK